MDTLSFLKLVLPPAPAYFVQLLTFPDDGPSKSGGSHRLPTLEHVAAFCERSAGKQWDVYISMAGFGPAAEGHFANYLWEHGSHKAHWIDLDCGADKPYKTIDDGLAALNGFLRAHPEIPVPLLVISGNGVHAYWPYTTPLHVGVWRSRAWALRRVMEASGLQIDGKCSIDPVRLLRPVNTWNRKDRDDPKLVRLYSLKQINYQPLDPDKVNAGIEKYREQYAIPVHIEGEQSNGAVSYESDLSAGMREPYTVAEVSQRCAIVQWHKANGGAPLKAGYPGMHNATWMAVAAVYKFSEEGEKLFHEHAKQYPGYSRREANGMLKRIDHSGPHCASLANTKVERMLCERCKFRSGLTSPVTLGTQRAAIMLKQVPAAPAAPAAAAPAETAIFAQSAPAALGEFSQAVPTAVPMFLINGPYRHTPRGPSPVIKTDTGDKLGPAFLSHHVESAKRLIEGEGITQYRFEFVSDDPTVQGDARRQSITLTSEQLGKQSGDVFAILFNHQITPKTSGKTNHVMGYLTEWVQHTFTDTGDTLASQMGHQDDGSFVIGQQRFKNGASTQIYLSSALDDIVLSYRPKGTLAGWQAAARVLADGTTKRHLQAQLGLAIAFGAPLMKYTDQFGALISFCTGESGRGKTTVGHLMSSVWGEPRRLLGNAHGDSPAHIYNHLARANTLPVLLDEATSTDPERMGMLLTLLGNGNAPGRANANGTNRRMFSWRTLGVTSTNHQISGKIGQKRSDGAGEQMRLLEFMFDQSPMPHDPQVHAAINAYMEGHFGVAGPEYAKLLTSREDEIRAAVNTRLARMREHWMKDPAERMWIATMAALMTGLALARTAGIINWNLDFNAFQTYLYENLQTMRLAYYDRHQPMLVQMMDTLGILMQKHGITVTPAKQPAGSAERLEVAESMNMPSEIYVRYDTLDGTLKVNARKFKEFAGENASAMRQDAERGGYLVGGTITDRLGKGLMELQGRELHQRVLVFDYRKLVAEVMQPARGTVTQLKPASS